MKYLYQAIAHILEGDATLIAQVGYTSKNLLIRRAYQPEGTWEKLVIYYLQPEIPIDGDISEKIRLVPLIVRVYDRDDDLNCDVIAERIKLILDGADLSVASKVHCYDCSYTGELIPVTRNNDLKTFEKAIRFSIKVRMDEVIGGEPIEHRQREN